MQFMLNFLNFLNFVFISEIKNVQKEDQNTPKIIYFKNIIFY